MYPSNDYIFIYSPSQSLFHRSLQYPKQSIYLNIYIMSVSASTYAYISLRTKTTHLAMLYSLFLRCFALSLFLSCLDPHFLPYLFNPVSLKTIQTKVNYSSRFNGTATKCCKTRQTICEQRSLSFIRRLIKPHVFFFDFHVHSRDARLSIILLFIHIAYICMSSSAILRSLHVPLCAQLTEAQRSMNVKYRFKVLIYFMYIRLSILSHDMCIYTRTRYMWSFALYLTNRINLLSDVYWMPIQNSIRTVVFCQTVFFHLFRSPFLSFSISLTSILAFFSGFCHGFSSSLYFTLNLFAFVTVLAVRPAVTLYFPLRLPFSTRYICFLSTITTTSLSLVVLVSLVFVAQLLFLFCFASALVSFLVTISTVCLNHLVE